MFYLPHWIWKQLEGGRLDLIIMGLNVANCDNKDVKIDQVPKYMKDRLRDQYDHKMWSQSFISVNFSILSTLSSKFVSLTDFWAGLSPTMVLLLPGGQALMLRKGLIPCPRFFQL